MRCFKGAVPRLLKVLTSTESARCLPLFLVLQKQTHVNPHLTSFDLQSNGKKSFMIMPCYASSLDKIPKLSLADGVRLFDQLRSAIDYLHSLNFNHMDIKSSNICLKENGDFVLVDLGSVVVKHEISASTVAYVPRDFQPRFKYFPDSKYEAVDVNDWLMLGMTIAEKVYRLKVGFTTPPPTVDELVTILEADGAFGELISLFHEV